MIEREDGEINRIIYDNTVYHNGDYHFYPTIKNLLRIIDKILLTKETTAYIRFNPFYVNSRLDRQIEFDQYMFFMECREDYTEDDLKKHLSQCMDHMYDIPHEVKQYDNMTENEKRDAHIRYPLCKNGDYKRYHEYLCNYREYLEELIPLLFKKAIEELNMNQDDVAFGYFCFEVNSE